ncbi:MAG: hypothetical protein HPM95_01080 [Alphaproteobacteria bacterium]|nr:hypothetical protein [Alphaproteobacteria bacterium]
MGRPRGCACVGAAGEGAGVFAGGDVAAFAGHDTDTQALLAYSAEIVETSIARSWICLPSRAGRGGRQRRSDRRVGRLPACRRYRGDERAGVPAALLLRHGLCPDGGWTALLPERIGAAKALEVQYLNTRLDARACRDLGLASRVVSPGRSRRRGRGTGDGDRLEGPLRA